MVESIFWISYEIRSRENGRVFEENSFLARKKVTELSIKEIKSYILETHSYDVKQHYVRIIQIQNIGSAESQMQTIIRQANEINL